MIKTVKLHIIKKPIEFLLLIAPLVFIIGYLMVFFLRFSFPFELKTLEGAMLAHVKRILSGEAIYVRPSYRFVPLLYTPLYYYVSALLSFFIGSSFIPLRIVSFISSLGCFFIIFQIVKRESKSIFAAISAVGLFAATFQASGSFFDLAKVDSLFLFFSLLAINYIRRQPSTLNYILAGLFFSLSFFTKQTALFFVPPIILYAFVFHRRHSCRLIGALVILIGGGSVILDIIHNGWFRFYIFEIGQHHQIKSEMFDFFWKRDILSFVPIAFFISLLYLIVLFFKSDRDKFFRMGSIFTGFIAGSVFSRMHFGGYANAVMPAYAFIAIMFGVALAEFLKLSDHPKRLAGWLTFLGICALYIIQFNMLRYDMFNDIPKKRELEAGQKILRTISNIDGEILFPNYSYFTTMAGKEGYANLIALWDIDRGKKKEEVDKVIDEFRSALQSQQFQAVILAESPLSFYLDSQVKKHYLKQKPLFNKNEHAFSLDRHKRELRPLIYVPRMKSDAEF